MAPVYLAFCRSDTAFNEYNEDDFVWPRFRDPQAGMYLQTGDTRVVATQDLTEINQPESWQTLVEAVEITRFCSTKRVESGSKPDVIVYANIDRPDTWDMGRFIKKHAGDEGRPPFGKKLLLVWFESNQLPTDKEAESFSEALQGKAVWRGQGFAAFAFVSTEDPQNILKKAKLSLADDWMLVEVRALAYSSVGALSPLKSWFSDQE